MDAERTQALSAARPKLVTMNEYLSVGRDQSLRHVELVVGEFGKAQSEVHVVVLSGLHKGVPLGRVVDERV